MVWFGLAAAAGGSDLLIKKYVKEYVQENSEKKLAHDKVILTKVFNKGAMLGAMKDKTQMLQGITLFGLGSIAGALMTYSGKRGHSCQKLGLALMLGGAASNGWERLSHGQVTDYIRFNIGKGRFKNIVFNKGDFDIFIGGLLWMVGEIADGR